MLSGSTNSSQVTISGNVATQNFITPTTWSVVVTTIAGTGAAQDLYTIPAGQIGYLFGCYSGSGYVRVKDPTDATTYMFFDQVAAGTNPPSFSPLPVGKYAAGTKVRGIATNGANSTIWVLLVPV